MSERDPLHSLFRPETTPDPPAGLLEELRRQIPAEIQPPVLRSGGRSVLPFDMSTAPRFWLAAASITVLLGGGSVIWLVFERYATFAAASGEAAPVATAEGTLRPAMAEARRDTAPTEPAPRDASAPATAATADQLAALGDGGRPAAALQRQATAPAPLEQQHIEASARPVPAPAPPAAIAGGAGRVARAPVEDLEGVPRVAAKARPERAELKKELQAGEAAANAQPAPAMRDARIRTQLDAAPADAPAAAAAAPLEEARRPAPPPPPTRTEAQRDTVEAPSWDGVENAEQALAAGRLPAAPLVTPSSMMAAVDSDGDAEREDVSSTLDAVADPWSRGALLVHARVTVPAESELDLRLVANADAVDRWALASQTLQPADDVRELRVAAVAGQPTFPHAIALLTVVPRADAAASAPLVTLYARWRPRGGTWREETRTLRVSEAAPSWDRSPARLRLAVVAARFAALLDDPTLDTAARATALDELGRRITHLADVLPRKGAGETARNLAHLVARARELVAAGAPRE